MVNDNKTRVVVISHTSFQGGSAGIQEAKEFGENLLKMIRGNLMTNDVAPEHRKELRKHLNGFKISVKKIDL